MRLLAGLGNPGTRYAAHRHNVGFMAVDAIAHAQGVSGFKKRWDGLLAEAPVAGEKTLIFKPQTYMNRVGPAIAEAARFYKLALEDVIVFHDDLDLALGKVRIKTGGGAGGHNGLRSIDAHLGNEYKRVRIGIGHPGRKELVESYVLSDFFKEERGVIVTVLKAIGDAAPALIAGNDGEFMNKIALAVQAYDREAGDGG